jgi:hypothetical protein
MNILKSILNLRDEVCFRGEPVEYMVVEEGKSFSVFPATYEAIVNREGGYFGTLEECKKIADKYNHFKYKKVEVIGDWVKISR